MIKFLNKYKIIFYLINFCIIFLYLFPGSIYGCVFLDDCSIQPQITADLALISSNHFYAFFVLSVIGYLTYIKKKHINYLIIYLFLNINNFGDFTFNYTRKKLSMVRLIWKFIGCDYCFFYLQSYK